jgi:hypothetical protein
MKHLLSKCARNGPCNGTGMSAESYDEMTRIEQHWDTHGFGPWLAALEFGFRELHLDTVVASAVEANTGSRRVMEKAGMVHRSDFDTHPPSGEVGRHIGVNRG